MTLYNRIEDLCKKQNMTITDLSRESGVNRASFSDLKKGRKKTLATSSLTKIAEYFNVTIDYLLTGETPAQKEKPAANDGYELSVEERVDQILNGMESEQTLMLDGNPMSDEAKEALRNALKMGVEYARKVNKEKK